MTLYVIFNTENSTDVSIKEVSITKSTDKQVSIKCEGISRKILTKSAIGTYLNEGHIYANSPEEALELWNKHHSDEASRLENEAKFTKSLIKKVDASTLIK